MIASRPLVLLSLALLAAAAPLPAALAQAWPSKPVHIAVPAPAGSSLDLIARLLGDKLKDR
jgi:tripartite-type tricarboxylate transporter receptor subunit TctC